MKTIGASAVFALLLLCPHFAIAGTTVAEEDERETLAGGAWHAGKFVACSDGIITSVHPRLEEPRPVHFDSGVAVEIKLPRSPRFFNGQAFANAAVVHYDGDHGNQLMESEKVGDLVQVCLVSFPTPRHDPESRKVICDPNEDTRGMIYRIYDYKHRAAYMGPDSQHSCGGA